MKFCKDPDCPNNQFDCMGLHTHGTVETESVSVYSRLEFITHRLAVIEAKIDCNIRLTEMLLVGSPAKREGES